MVLSINIKLKGITLGSRTVHSVGSQKFYTSHSSAGFAQDFSVHRNKSFQMLIYRDFLWQVLYMYLQSYVHKFLQS